MLQMYTQNGGVRPFGSALIIGGVYDGICKLFETDPSGALIEYKATAIGSADLQLWISLKINIKMT